MKKSPRILYFYLGALFFVIVWQWALHLNKENLTDSYRILANGYPTTGGAHLLLHHIDQWVGRTDPGIMLGNLFFFVCCLLLFFSVQFLANRPVIGFVGTLLLGSSPLLLFEVHGRENIFAWMGITAIFCIAFARLILITNNVCLTLLAAFTMGWIVGWGAMIRGDILVFLPGCILWFIFCGRVLRFNRTFWGIALLITGFVFATHLPHATNYMRNGTWSLGHTPHQQWFTVWLGVGDFDNHYGIKFDDIVAHAYGQKPFFGRVGSFEFNELFSKEYDASFRDDFLHRVTSNPLWYMEILCKRIVKIMTDYVPIDIHLIFFKFSIWYPPWINGILLVSVFVMMIRSSFYHLTELWFASLTCGTALFLTTEGNMSYLCILPMFILTIFLDQLSLKWISLKKV